MEQSRGAVRAFSLRLLLSLTFQRFLLFTTVFLFVWGVKLLFLAWFKITPILHIRYTWIDLVVPCTALAMIVHLFRAFYRSNGARRDRSQGGEHE